MIVRWLILATNYIAFCRLNSSVNVVPYCVQLASKNALGIIKEYDIVADCSDNAATRYVCAIH